MSNLFTRHPHSVGETYWEHMRFALSFGLNMVIGGFACIIHAFLPFLFIRAGSDKAIKVVNKFVKRMPVMENNLIVLSQYIENKRTR